MGFISLYVDDVLLAAKKEVIIAAMKRIEIEWPLMADGGGSTTLLRL